MVTGPPLADTFEKRAAVGPGKHDHVSQAPGAATRVLDVADFFDATAVSRDALQFLFREEGDLTAVG